MSVKTQTGIPILECSDCGQTHPITRQHCAHCGQATLFAHQACEVRRE